MRPIKVEFQAFGPYAGHETVDFEDIASRGLFLICGKTGIGKTMIIDAMTFALFGKSSGNGRDDFESMRCTKADFKTSTIVDFQFEHNGEYYRFQRRLDRKTKNLSESRDVSIRDEKGNWRTLFENARKDDVNKKAEEIIGLTYDQFRQVIVLPQGQFEKLLTSDSNEKEKILTSIFGVDKWRRIAERFLEEAVARNSELTGIKDRILTSLRDEECETLEELQDRIDSLKEEKKDLEKRYADEGFEARIKELQDMLEASGRIAELRRNLAKREKEEQKAVDDEAASREDAKAAEESLKAHLEREEEIKALGELKTVYESKREDYRTLKEAEDNLDNAKKDETRTGKGMKSAGAAVDKCAEALALLKEEYDRLDGEHRQLVDRYISGITGELAKGLVKGEPCPVCGSTDHPSMARFSEETVSKKDVDAKKAQADKKYSEMDPAGEEHEKAKAAFEDARKEHEDACSRVKVCEGRLSDLRGSAIEGISTLEDLEDAINDLIRNTEAYDRRKKELEANDAKAKQDHSNAMERIKTARTEIETAKRNLKEAEDEMKGVQAESEEDIRTRLDETNEAANRQSRQIALAESDIARLEKKAAALREDSKGLDEKIRQAEADVAFGKKLRGDSGTGLQRYVLGIMFSSVVAEANRMLELVHGGRYRLFRTDDKGKGNKRGLELKVHDRNSDDHEGRFVGTLSGGEKFLAALALSIGMANVARKSGIGIDALFIDEGFGTLDEASIGDAMSILDSIQKAKGLVGIISHMQILRDNIPTKLRVEGGEEGSHIIPEIG